jgi:iron complex transport system substrate-binding protein
MPRIVSLIASATEIVYALGLGKYVVGRSHECDFPEGVKNLPVCTAPRSKTEGTEIDQNVKTIVRESLSVYHVDVELLEKLQPTHIITHPQCDACAVSMQDLEAASCQVISSKPQIISLSPNSLEDIWSDIRRIGIAFGAEEKVKWLTTNLQKRVAAVATIAGYLKPVTVACLDWMDPLTAAGNWMPELVQLAGGKNVFEEPKENAPILSWEALRAKNPEVIIISPCGFNIERTMSEMPLLTRQLGFDRLSAVIYDRVFVVDGNQFFNRAGPRVAESLEMMAELLHPESFDFGYEGVGWVRCSTSS